MPAMTKRIAALSFAAMLAGGPATAQTGQPAWMEIADGVTVAPFSMTVDQLDDFDVHDASGRKIGEVEEVLGTSPDSPSALAIDFDDGAGYGDRGDVIVPLEMFRLDGGRLILSLDAGAIASMPVWRD